MVALRTPGPVPSQGTELSPKPPAHKDKDIQCLGRGMKMPSGEPQPSAGLHSSGSFGSQTRHLPMVSQISPACMSPPPPAPRLPPSVTAPLLPPMASATSAAALRPGARLGFQISGSGCPWKSPPPPPCASASFLQLKGPLPRPPQVAGNLPSLWDKKAALETASLLLQLQKGHQRHCPCHVPEMPKVLPPEASQGGVPWH